jgi:hypothetical protein
MAANTHSMHIIPTRREVLEPWNIDLSTAKAAMAEEDGRLECRRDAVRGRFGGE